MATYHSDGRFGFSSKRYVAEVNPFVLSRSGRGRFLNITDIYSYPQNYRDAPYGEHYIDTITMLLQ